MDYCEQELLNAVVLQAVKDYQEALVEQRNADRKVKELEKFFTGDYFEPFSKLDGPTLMASVKQQLIEHNFNIKKIEKTRYRSEKEEAC